MNLHTEIIDINGYALNIKEMWGLSNDSEDVYLKVDEICAKYGKEFKDFFKDSSKNREIGQELIATKYGISKRGKPLLTNEAHEIGSVSKPDNPLLTKLPYKPSFYENLQTVSYMQDDWNGTFPKDSKENYKVEGIRYNKFNLDYLAYRLSGRAKDMKEEVKGTYIHKDLLIPFLMWVDGKVAVKLIKAIDGIIKDYYNLKRERREATEMFWKFKEARKKYLPFENDVYGENFDAKCMDAINITVLGCRASTFKRRKGVSSAGYTREWLSEEQLEHINWCQEEVCAYLKYYKMDDYTAIKDKLHDDYVSEFGVI